MGLYRRKWRRKDGKVVTSKPWWMSVMVDGCQHCESTGTSNKRLAQKILDKRKGEIAEGRFRLVPGTSPALKPWSDQFLETIGHNNTKRVYESCAKVLLKFFGENARLSQVTANRIEDFKQTRLSSGAGPATINRNLAVLRRMLKIAFRRRLIAQNPFDEIELLSERNRRQPRILTFEEEAQLLAVATPMLRTLVVLLVESGARVGEALALTWSDIDLANSSIRIRQSKTPSGRRLIPLSEQCKTELSRWREMTGPAFSSYLFFNPRNVDAHLLKLPKTWTKTLKKAKIEYFPIYNLRATFASRLSAAGNSDNLVAGLLGHSTPSIVHTYAKVLDEYRRDAIRKLEGYRQNHQAKPDEPTTDVVIH
jgi:integrase